jgi:G3E family GTPase
MQIEKLRSLIREAVDNQLKEIEAVAEAAAMEARLAEYDKAIKTCESKIQAAENLEEVKDLMDEGKLNELKKKLKSLTKAKEKLEKAKAKKNKGKEVTTDAETDKEETVDEGPYNQNNNMGDDIENANVDETYTMDEMENDSMKEEALNESFLKMQKLAGVITEAEYKEKTNELFGFGKSKTAFKVGDQVREKDNPSSQGLWYVKQTNVDGENFLYILTAKGTRDPDRPDVRRMERDLIKTSK